MQRSLLVKIVLTLNIGLNMVGCEGVVFYELNFFNKVELRFRHVVALYHEVSCCVERLVGTMSVQGSVYLCGVMIRGVFSL